MQSILTTTKLLQETLVSRVNKNVLINRHTQIITTYRGVPEVDIKPEPGQSPSSYELSEK